MRAVAAEQRRDLLLVRRDRLVRELAALPAMAREPMLGWRVLAVVLILVAAAATHALVRACC